MTGGRRKGSENGETKKAIIEFLLKNNKENHKLGIQESKIRKHLEKQIGIRYEGSVRNHLKDLLNDENGPCLVKFLGDKGLPNHWDITKIEHLRSIKNRFPDIHFNKFEKSLMIVLKKNSYDIFTFDGIHFYVKLLLSPSFFSACMDTDSGILYDRAQIIYDSKYPLQALEMRATLEICYSLYNNRYPNLKLSFESFKSMITQMTQKEEMSYIKRILMEKSPTEQKIFAEKFMEIWEDELLGLPKEKSDELHQETMEKDLRIYWDMSVAAYKLKEFNFSSERKRYYLLFESYFHLDVLADIASEDEINYVIETRANEESDKFQNVDDNDDPNYLAYLGGERVIKDLEQDSIILAKYKHPSIFRDFYKDPLATCGCILKFLYMGTDQVKKYIPLLTSGDHGDYLG